MFGRSELNDMWKTIIGVFCVLFLGWLMWFVFFYSDVGCDYTTVVEVDDSLKVEQAISNAVNDVKSRNFIVIKLGVETWNDKTFRVTCGGVDKANLWSR